MVQKRRGSPDQRGLGADETAQYRQQFGTQLDAMQVPAELHSRLFEKLQHGIFDAGSVFSFEEHANCELCLHATRNVDRHEDIWLIDHAVVCPASEMHGRVYSDDAVVQRLASVMDLVEREAWEPPVVQQGAPQRGDFTVGELIAAAGSPVMEEFGNVVTLDLSGMGLNDEQVRSVPIGELFPMLSFINLDSNNIQHAACITHLLDTLPGLRGVSVRGNPVKLNHAGFTARYPRLELISGKVTAAYTAWALYVLCGVPMTVEGQNVVPSQPLPRCVDLRDVGLHELKRDAFDTFADVVSLDLRNNAFDAASMRGIASRLHSVATLYLDRTVLPWVELVTLIPSLTHVNSMAREHVLAQRPDYTGTLADNVARRLPAYTNHYLLIKPSADGALEEQVDVAFVMDEVGSRMHHSTTPNFVCVPFFFHGSSFSVCWPTRSLARGDEVTIPHPSTPTTTSSGTGATP